MRPGAPPGRDVRPPKPVPEPPRRNRRAGTAALEAAGSPRPKARSYASKRRKIVTAFWPPKPKPLIATVSTFAVRATSGT